MNSGIVWINIIMQRILKMMMKFLMNVKN
ncbi:hypothetical protein BLA29_013615 [Euroglyphus maynei]|uniref:Uncharacterized protein n=1 Tax=Euroglyphus maynei TaxID=6958 RepID=A0A1Y3B898_EURMA|nr:hypothetical protein BLA29_013615 [Euroglyphus maynei]